MKTYIAEWPGKFLPASAVVRASSEAEAAQMVIDNWQVMRDNNHSLRDNTKPLTFSDITITEVTSHNFELITDGDY